MSEEEYIKVSNKTALILAKNAMSEVMQGDEYGVNTDDYKTAMICIGNMVENIFRELDGAITPNTER